MAGSVAFQFLLIAAAWGISFITDPPACFIAYSFPVPFANCPGLQLGRNIEYVLALPGVVIALPFFIVDLWISGKSKFHPWFLLPISLYVLAGIYLVRLLLRR